MKKLVFRFSIILGVIASLVCFMPKLSNKTYAAQENTQASHYLLDNDGTAYLSTVEAGEVFGYGSYAVGNQATLQATANDGFTFVGWEIEETIHSASFEIDYDFTDDGTDNPETVNYSIISGINNTLVISKVPKDLTVRAVFDYQYHDLILSEDIVNTLALNEEDVLVSGQEVSVKYPKNKQVGDDTITYKTQESGITTYTNAIVDYKFYEELHYDGTSLYTTPSKNTTNENETIKVDYSRGGFRYNDSFEIEFDLDIVSDMELSKNYDIQSFSLNGVTVPEDNCEITKDEFSRTAEFSVSGSIVENSLLTWDADMLTVVDLVPYINNGDQLNEAVGEDAVIISNQVRIDNHYSKVTDSRYLIKDPEYNENNQAATIKYEQRVGKQIDGVNYFYFEIGSIIVKSTGDKLKYSNGQVGIVSTGSYEEFKMVYLPINFEINFEARLSSNLQEKFRDLKLDLETCSIIRGQTYSLQRKGISYPGYELKGFISDQKELKIENINTDSITVEIDKTKPVNITIYLIFDKIDYLVRLNNVDRLNLIKTNADSSTTTIPSMAKVKTYNGTQLTENYSNTQNANSGILTAENYLFTTKFKLNETFKFEINANAGFKIGLSLLSTKMDSADLADFARIQQTLDEEYLKNESYKVEKVAKEVDGETVDENIYVIDLYLHSAYETYTFKFRIDPATHGSNSVIMADISATKPDRTEVVMSTTEEGSTDPKSQVITITNVRLYDEIPIKAVVKKLPGTETYYNFQKFVSSGGIGFSNFVNNKTEFSYTYVVAGNETISAMFSAPESQLKISIDNDEAYDISQIIVYYDQNKNNKVEKTEEVKPKNGAYMVSGMVEVVLDKINIIADGYYFEGFSIKTFKDGVEQSANVQNLIFDDNVITFTMDSPEAHELRISCPEVIYQINATQVGAGVDASDIVFQNSASFVNLTLSKRDLEFTYPKAGIYASVVKENGNDISENFAQDYNRTQNYSKTLTKDELLELAEGKTISNDGIVKIQLDFEYSLVTFSVTIDLLQEVDKNKKTYENINDYIEIVASYKVGDTEISVDNGNIDKTNENKIVINNIPYAAKNLTLNVNVTENVGLTHFKWQETQDGVIDSSDTTKVVFVNDISDYKLLQYSVQYKLYEVKLEYKSDEGAPTVTVNGLVGKAEISALDNLQIDAKALKDNGYKFVAMYQKYVYNADTWGTEKTQLFVKTINGFAKVTKDETYDPAETYYLKMLMDESNSNLYTIDEVMLSNYYIYNDKTITMLMVYEYIEFTINHVATLDSKSASIIKPVEEYAVFKIKSGEDELSPTEKLNISTGSVTVEVCMADIEVDGLTINLITGVDLLEATTVVGGGKGLTWNNIETDINVNKYYFEVDISSIIPYIADDAEVVTFTYTFKVKTFKTTLTTNVPKGASFYTQTIDGLSAFFMKASDLNDNEEATDNDASELKVERPFLDKVFFSYGFRRVSGEENDLKKYFKIEKVIIKVGNKVLTQDEYDANGINIEIQETVFGEGEEKVVEKTIVVHVLYLLDNLTIELQVEPIVYLKGAENGVFNRTYKYNFDLNEAVAQDISIGTTSDCDIQMFEFLYNALVKDDDGVVLTFTSETGNFVADMINVGTYVVTFYFQNSGEYAWLSQLTLINQVKVKINPLELELSQTSVTETLQKEYDGNNTVSFDVLRKLINISGKDYAGQTKKVNLADNNVFSIGCTSAVVINEKDEAVSAARDIPYNVRFDNLTIGNNNFTIKDIDNFKVKQCIKINRKVLSISNIQFYDKVYDGTTSLSFSNMGEVTISGIVGNGDDVRLNFENIIIEFEDANIGLHKKVVVKNFENCLIGTAKGNYIVNHDSFKITTAPSIYPYSVFVNIEGYGKIEIVNERGKTDQSLVSLIPIGAEFQIIKIDRGGSTYTGMYQIIEEYLGGNKEFEVGYELKFVVDGKDSKISNQLYLNLPTVESLRNIISVTGEYVVNLKFDIANSQATVDLSQIPTDVHTIVMISSRSLFKIWQIVVIVGVIVLIILSIVITIVIIRRRKLKKYSINEKI